MFLLVDKLHVLKVLDKGRVSGLVELDILYVDRVVCSYE